MIVGCLNGEISACNIAGNYDGEVATVVCCKEVAHQRKKIGVDFD